MYLIFIIIQTINVTKKNRDHVLMNHIFHLQVISEENITFLENFPHKIKMFLNKISFIFHVGSRN